MTRRILLLMLTLLACANVARAPFLTIRRLRFGVLLLLLFLGLSGTARAQGTRKDDIVINSRGLPAGGVSVAVCAQPAVTSTQPCSPLANLYSNPQLTQALVNPLTTDGLGNYTFYAAPGKYTIQIYGPTVTTKVIPDVVLPNDPSTPSFNTVTTTSGISAFSLTLSGNLTVQGSASVTLGLSAATLTLANQGSPPTAPATGNVIVYSKTDKKVYWKDETGLETAVGGGGRLVFVSAQVGATADLQIQAAMAALPSTGGTVIVDLLGAQTIASDVFSGVTKNVQLIWTSGQYTFSVASTFPANISNEFSEGVNWISSSPTVKLVGPIRGPSDTIFIQSGLGKFILLTGDSSTGWVDASWFGARAVDKNNPPSTTGSITSGTSTLTLAGASTFRNGDGIVIYGAMPAPTMTTPTTPTVTPKALTGATTYQYQVVAKDINGGLTAASTAGSTTIGAATLGKNTLTISSVSRAANSNVVTVTTSATHNLAVGAIVIISGVTDTSFVGYFLVDSTTSTTFTYTQGIKNFTASAQTSIGGTVVVYAFNHVTWSAVTGAEQYIIYGRTGGGMTYLGMANFKDTQFDDYGTTLMANTPQWSYVPNSPPAAAQSGYLATNIISGAGTTTLTLGANALTTVSAATVKQDSAYGILQAANSQNPAAGTIYLHPATNNTANNQGMYFINSRLVLPNFQLTYFLSNPLLVNETITVQPNTTISGRQGTNTSGNVAFSYQNGTQIVGIANPYFYNPGGSGSLLEYLNIGQNNTNGPNYFGSDTGTSWVFKHVNFMGDSTSPLTVAVNLRGDFGYLFDTCAFNGGAINGNQPMLGFLRLARHLDGTAGTGMTHLKDTNFTGRSVLIDNANAPDFMFDNGFYQSGLTPFLMILGGNGGFARFSDYQNADFAIPLLANWVNGNTLGLWVVNAAGSASASLVTGYPLQALRLVHTFPGSLSNPMIGQNIGQNFQMESMVAQDQLKLTNTNSNPTQTPYTWSAEPHLFPNGDQLIWPMASPTTAPTATVVAGGSLALGNYQYECTAVDWEGRETLVSLPSTQVTTTSGNQKINLTCPTVAGVEGFNFYRSFNGGSYGRHSNFYPISTTNTYTDDGTIGSWTLQPTAVATAATTAVTPAAVTATVLRIPSTTVQGAKVDLVAGSCNTACQWSFPATTIDTFVGASATQTLGGKTLTSPKLSTSVILNPSSGVPAITLLWANPAANANITFGDPGGNDNVAYLAAVQTFTNKTFSSGTITGSVGGSPTATGTWTFSNQVTAPSFKATSGPFTAVWQTLCTSFSTTDQLTANGLEQAFATTCSIPANTLGTNNTIQVQLGGIVLTSATPPTFRWKLKLGGVVLYDAAAATPGASEASVGVGAIFLIQGMAAPSASSNTMTNPTGRTNTPEFLGFLNSVVQPIALATNGALTISVTWTTGATDAGTKVTLSQMVVTQVN